MTATKLACRTTQCEKPRSSCWAGIGTGRPARALLCGGSGPVPAPPPRQHGAHRHHRWLPQMLRRHVVSVCVCASPRRHAAATLHREPSVLSAVSLPTASARSSPPPGSDPLLLASLSAMDLMLIDCAAPLTCGALGPCRVVLAQNAEGGVHRQRRDDVQVQALELRATVSFPAVFAVRVLWAGHGVPCVPRGRVILACGSLSRAPRRPRFTRLRWSCCRCRFANSYFRTWLIRHSGPASMRL